VSSSEKGSITPKYSYLDRSSYKRYILRVVRRVKYSSLLVYFSFGYDRIFSPFSPTKISESQKITAMITLVCFQYDEWFCSNFCTVSSSDSDYSSSITRARHRAKIREKSGTSLVKLVLLCRKSASQQSVCPSQLYISISAHIELAGTCRYSLWETAEQSKHLIT
jgi:hypothetical protein